MPHNRFGIRSPATLGVPLVPPVLRPAQFPPVPPAQFLPPPPPQPIYLPQPPPPFNSAGLGGRMGAPQQQVPLHQQGAVAINIPPIPHQQGAVAIQQPPGVQFGPWQTVDVFPRLQQNAGASNEGPPPSTPPQYNAGISLEGLPQPPPPGSSLEKIIKFLRELSGYTNGVLQMLNLAVGGVALVLGGAIGSTLTGFAFAGGVAYAICLGGRLMIFFLEIQQDVREATGSLPKPPNRYAKKTVTHPAEVTDIIHRILKGFIQVTSLAVTVMLNTQSSNWVVKYPYQVVTCLCGAIEAVVLAGEVGCHFVAASEENSWTVPPKLDNAFSIARGVVQISILTTGAAAHWMGSSNISVVVGKIQTALAAARTASFALEIGVDFWESRYHKNKRTAAGTPEEGDVEAPPEPGNPVGIQPTPIIQPVYVPAANPHPIFRTVPVFDDPYPI